MRKPTLAFTLLFAAPVIAVDLDDGIEIAPGFEFGVPHDLLMRFGEQGHAQTHYQIGLSYHSGQGVAQDYEEALKWYRKAAERGHPRAQNNLGVLYGNGQGAPRDHVKAYAWLNLASEQGDEVAMKNLGVLEQRMTFTEITEAAELAKVWAEKYGLE